MGQPGLIDPNTPDGDPGKFLLRGRPARAIHLHDGYHLKIRSEWFRDVEALPVINGGEFDWYVFAVEPRREVPEPHYLILHHTTMKSLVLDFKAPRGRNWRDQDHWMANIRPFSDGTAYFRWGDEPANDFGNRSRRFKLDNLADQFPDAQGGQVSEKSNHGTAGGESESHKQIKTFVAAHPEAVGLAASAVSEVEHGFLSGDMVDVWFKLGRDRGSVVEVEVSGAQDLLIGVHQAIKYRALAAVELGVLALGPSPEVDAAVAAHAVDYREAQELAVKYQVRLVAVSAAAVAECKERHQHR